MQEARKLTKTEQSLITIGQALQVAQSKGVYSLADACAIKHAIDILTDELASTKEKTDKENKPVTLEDLKNSLKPINDKRKVKFEEETDQ